MLRLDKKSRTPIYLQLSNEFIKHISSGLIQPGAKLPGTRQLSDILKLNRRTIIAAFDELMAQGWINVYPNKGCYVKEHLPNPKPKKLTGNAGKDPVMDGFGLVNSLPEQQVVRYNQVIDDGYPDIRLAPLKELGKNYSFIMNSSMANQLMTYKQRFYGDELLRFELTKYLSETRSINVSSENIMITRGSLMAFYVLFKSILSRENDQVVVAYPGFNEGYETIKLAGGKLNYVEVDEQGMCTDQLAAICSKKKIRAVFIIPHHHYPTTVSLSAQRRMELLEMAEKHHFAIIEDDYDYDFHYASAPILPIASIDHRGCVAYVGSFSKTVAPALRIGFIVAPKQVIEATAQVGKYIDSFGNTSLEHAVGMLFQEGLIRRHLRKAVKVYRERRDHFCDLFSTELGEFFDLKIPEGGLAAWTELKKSDLKTVREKCEQHRIHIPDATSYFAKPFEKNALRIGFASRTKTETAELIHSLKTTLQR